MTFAMCRAVGIKLPRSTCWIMLTNRMLGSYPQTNWQCGSTIIWRFAKVRSLLFGEVRSRRHHWHSSIFLKRDPSRRPKEANWLSPERITHIGSFSLLSLKSPSARWLNSEVEVEFMLDGLVSVVWQLHWNEFDPEFSARDFDRYHLLPKWI